LQIYFEQIIVLNSFCILQFSDTGRKL